MRSTLLGLIFILLVSCIPARAEVSLDKVTYHGWTDSYRLTAGDYSLVVVPQIGGRIMEYSLYGKNVMWENKEESGRIYPVSNEWRNYGGYKTWVSPQDWSWPPDFLMDSGRANVEIMKNAEGTPVVKVIGAPSPKLGIYFIKEITLAEDGEVTVRQRMRNISEKSVTYGIWDVTQVETPCFVVFPVSPKSKFKDGLNCITAEARNTDQFSIVDGLCVTTYRGQVADISSDSPGPWMVWFKDDLAYVKYFGQMKKGAQYPWNGSSCEVFTSKQELGYVEMEVHGPLVQMKPGTESELTAKWRIYKLTQPVTDQNRSLKAIKGMQGRGWL